MERLTGSNPQVITTDRQAIGRGIRINEPAAGQRRMNTAQAWHTLNHGKPRNVIVSNQESIVLVRALDESGKPCTRKKLTSIPVLHNMHQVHEFMAKHAEANWIPSSHYRHRLTITGERLVDGAGMFGAPKVMPIYHFRKVKTRFARKLARLTPRGKAYQRVQARTIKQALEARS